MSYQSERTKLLGVDDEQTRSLSAEYGYEIAEEEAERLAEEARNREFERAARAKALGSVPVNPDDELPEPSPERADNDKFLGSFGLFWLRLVLVAFVGVRGIQVMFDIDATATWLGNLNVPATTLLAWVLGVVLLLCSLMLLFGFGTRAAALVVVVLAVAVLVFVRWGAGSLFTTGQAGFAGEAELLVAGIALALVFLGSGGWAVDGAMRHSRWLDKN